jgi:hypothetical protein
MPEIHIRVVFDKVDPDITGAEALDIVALLLGGGHEADPSRIAVRAVKAIPNYTRETIEKLIVNGRDQKGLGWSAMAEQFNAKSIPTLNNGAEWRPSTMQRIYNRVSKGTK